MILWRFSQFAFFSERARWGISLYGLAHGSGGHVRANRLKPRAPIYTYTEHAQFVDVSKFKLWRRTVSAVQYLSGTRDVVSKLFITSRVPIRKKQFGRAMSN